MQQAKEQTIREVVSDYLQSELIDKDPEIILTPDTSLIVSGLIDSLKLFRLINFVQNIFGVKIAPAEITLENFATIASIEALIDRSINGACEL